MNLLLKLIFFANFLFVFVFGVDDNLFDYCSLENDKTCSNHIGCKNTIVESGDKTTKILNITSITSDTKLKLLLLINVLKNEFALGKIENVDTAAKLDVISWDNDLEEVAEIASQKILPSLKYLNSIYCSNTLKRNNTYTFLLENEGSITDAQILASLGTHLGDSVFGRFYRLAFLDKLIPMTYIGCKHILYEENKTESEDKKVNSYIRCIYQELETDQSEYYVKGIPCSQCVTKCDSLYTGLCKSVLN